MSLEENYLNLRADIAQTAEKAGRAGDEIGVVVVTKQVTSEAVRSVYRVGATMVGENRVQEALRKRSELSDLPLEWHLIGHLQTNKVKQAVEAFSLIHSVDRLPLAEALAVAAQKAGKVQEILVQVNVSGEASKFGLPLAEALDGIRAVMALPGLSVKGLMTIAPYGEPEEARRHFRRLRELFEEAREIPGSELTVLSMGMSNDYRVAIEEGATLLRIGTAIFGERNKQNLEEEC
ncbi:MAG TPA: YggS family pyridoxal phosphate-dependent enzyme [Cyanobacteria bacterium UBA8530]|nr:YggS family pyridoxal phosphate-dependent enzyme [Cyanobacteria bacterium UBA8530]